MRSNLDLALMSEAAVGEGPRTNFNNLDFRIARTFPIREKINLQFLGEAFNLLNHANILGVSTTGYFYIKPGATADGVTCPAASGTFNGCIAPEVAPYTSTPVGTPTSTSGVLYTERQLQFSAKLFF